MMPNPDLHTLTQAT